MRPCAAPGEFQSCEAAAAPTTRIEIPKFIKPPGDAPAPRWFHVAALRSSAAMTSLVEQNARLVRASSTPILHL
jgi:hypothetical protein